MFLCQVVCCFASVFLAFCFFVFCLFVCFFFFSFFVFLFFCCTGEKQEDSVIFLIFDDTFFVHTIALLIFAREYLRAQYAICGV